MTCRGEHYDASSVQRAIWILLHTPSRPLEGGHTFIINAYVPAAVHAVSILIQAESRSRTYASAVKAGRFEREIIYSPN